MPTNRLDAIVIGAGQAGLGTSYVLKQAGHSHIVFERGEVGQTWRTQRWDSFALNTPNWSNSLPGAPYSGDQPDGFWLTAKLITYFEDYIQRFDLPVQTGMRVTSVTQDGDAFKVTVENGAGGTAQYSARNVIVASGFMHQPIIPALSAALPGDILQLHVATYRNPGSLPPGGVIIVGSGQSGGQIAEDVIQTGREVYLCSSKVGRLPRRYRGREMMDWWKDSGFWDVATKDLEDPAMVDATLPLISGVGRLGHSLSLQYLARQGVKVVGRLADVKDGTLYFDDSARENVHFGDVFAARATQGIDAYIEQAGLDAPPNQPHPADEPDPGAACVTDIDHLNLANAGVGTLIWATGFGANFDWLKVGVTDNRGQPIHDEGRAPVAGIYFIGAPWLTRRKSATILGIEDDAHAIVAHLQARL